MPLPPELQGLENMHPQQAQRILASRILRIEGEIAAVERALGPLPTEEQMALKP